MKVRMRWVIISLLLGFVLASCGNRQQEGLRTGAKVSVSVAFPPRSGLQSSMLRLIPVGAPEAAEIATVKIFDRSQNLVQTVILTRSRPSASVVLDTGTYDFEVSIADGQTPPLEVAWGKKVGVAITDDTAVELGVKSILRDLTFGTADVPIEAGDLVGVELAATSKPGSRVFYKLPLGDLDSVDWQVTGGTLVGGGKLGAEVAWNGTDSVVHVTAQVRGMGEDHQPTTLTKDLRIAPFTRAGGALTVRGRLDGWRGPDGARLVLANNHGQPALDLGIIQSDGSFQAVFPSGNDFVNHTDALSQLDVFWTSCANADWTDAPEPAVINDGHLLVTSSSGQVLAEVTNSGAQQSVEGFFVYVDREVVVQGSADCYGIRYNFDIQAQAGWNWVERETDPLSKQGTVTVRPVTSDPFSIPESFVWSADVRYTDLGLVVPDSTLSPTVGQDFLVQFVVENQSGTDPASFEVHLGFDDTKLSVVSVNSSPDMSPSYDAEGKVISFAGDLGVGESVTVALTLRAASGTEGSSLGLSITVDNPGWPGDINSNNNTATITITPQQSATQNNVELALDLLPPEVSFVEPENEATLDRALGKAMVRLKVVEDVEVVDLELYRGFQLLGSLTQGEIRYESGSGMYYYIWDLSGVSPGIYRLVAVAYDTTGNTGQAEVRVRVQ